MGEAETFDDYVRGRIGALTRTAYLLTGDHAHADDLVQTALAKCYLAWTRIEDPDAYVRRTMANTQRSWWRRRKFREVSVAHVPERPAAGDIAAQFVQRQLVLLAHQDV